MIPNHIRLWRVHFRVVAPWGGDVLGSSGEKFVIAPSKAKAKEVVLGSREWKDWYPLQGGLARGACAPAPSIGEVKLLAVSGPIMEQTAMWEGE